MAGLGTVFFVEIGFYSYGSPCLDEKAVICVPAECK